MTFINQYLLDCKHTIKIYAQLLKLNIALSHIKM